MQARVAVAVMISVGFCLAYLHFVDRCRSISAQFPAFLAVPSAHLLSALTLDHCLHSLSITLIPTLVNFGVETSFYTSTRMSDTTDNTTLAGM